MHDSDFDFRPDLLLEVELIPSMESRPRVLVTTIIWSINVQKVSISHCTASPSNYVDTSFIWNVV